MLKIDFPLNWPRQNQRTFKSHIYYRFSFLPNGMVLFATHRAVQRAFAIKFKEKQVWEEEREIERSE